MKTSNELSKPACFATQADWARWLALLYQSGEFDRLERYPKALVVALDHVIESLEKQRQIELAAGRSTEVIEKEIARTEARLVKARARQTDFSSRELNYCIDCTPANKAKHMAAGTCSRPGTKFVLVYSPETNETDIEGDCSVTSGRYATQADRARAAAEARARVQVSSEPSLAF